jgi:hypothetical protein
MITSIIADTIKNNTFTLKLLISNTRKIGTINEIQQVKPANANETRLRKYDNTINHAI